MSLNKRCITVLALLSFLFLQDIFAAQNLDHKILDNGLEIFILENKNTPLVTIELVFRAGSSYQTEETEGIFHLYEHMLFKGNLLYKNSSEVRNALTDLGVADYNGSTAHDYVNYYFTIPASSFENGLEFWSAAVITPKFDETELEHEKKVVISEISSFLHNKNQKAMFEYNGKMFGNNKFTFSPSGNPEKVEKCTAAMLKKMQAEFYCPDNCAIFITGNIECENAEKLVAKYFGNWKKSDKEFLNVINENAAKKNTLDKNYFYFCTNPNYSATCMFYFVGPDTENSREQTYSADLISNILNDTSGNFYKKIKKLKTSDKKEAVLQNGCSYLTTKINGIYGFSFELEQNNNNILSTVNQIEKIQKDEFSKMCSSGYFSKHQMRTIKNSIMDEKILQEENPNIFMEGYRYFWAVSDADYAKSYYEKMNQVNENQLAEFSSAYFENKNFICILYLNNLAYENQIPGLIKNGFEEIK